ncbi:MAG: hypothetical protein ACLTMP_04675 [Eggerthella lenta]
MEYYGFVRAMQYRPRQRCAAVIDSTLASPIRINASPVSRPSALRHGHRAEQMGSHRAEAKAEIRERIADRLTFVAMLRSSPSRRSRARRSIALGRQNAAYENYSQTIPTNRLNTWLAGIRVRPHGEQGQRCCA